MTRSRRPHHAVLGTVAAALLLSGCAPDANPRANPDPREPIGKRAPALAHEAETTDSEIVPPDEQPPDIPISIAEPFYGDVGVDRVALAARVLGLETPQSLTTEDAEAILAQARDVLASGNVAGPQVRQDIAVTLAALRNDGPAVDPTIDVGDVLASARSEVQALAVHHGIELPSTSTGLATAAREIADKAGIPEGLELHVRLAMAQQRRVLEEAATRVAEALGGTAAQVQLEQLADGSVPTARIVVQTADGPVRLWLAGLHPADPTVDIRASAPLRLQGTTTHAASVPGAVAAVNGGFWTQGADPDGLTVIDGVLVSDTSSGKSWVRDRRPAFGIDDEKAVVGLPSWSLRIAHTREAQPTPVRGYERPVEGPDDVVATLGRPAPAPPGTPTVAYDIPVQDLLREHVSFRARVDPSRPVPSGRVRVFVTGQQMADHAAKDKSLLRFSIDPAFAGLDNVVAGGPTLLRGGSVLEEAVWRREGFAEAHTDRRHPRTFTGVDRWGNVLLAVVDGRQPGWSAGLTQTQTAAVARALSLVDAVQLDGGGSSTFVQSGRILNRPSDGRERPVATALVIRRRSI